MRGAVEKYFASNFYRFHSTVPNYTILDITMKLLVQYYTSIHQRFQNNIL